jgi:hypothetical protein
LACEDHLGSDLPHGLCLEGGRVGVVRRAVSDEPGPGRAEMATGGQAAEARYRVEARDTAGAG